MLNAFEVFLTLLLPGSHPLQLMSVLPLDVLQHLLQAEYLFHELIGSPLKLFLSDPLGVQAGEGSPRLLIYRREHIAAVTGDLCHWATPKLLTPEIQLSNCWQPPYASYSLE